MLNSPKFFICKHCGNLVEAIHYSGAKIICCGKPMSELVANTEEASTEKHIPVVTLTGNLVTIAVGSAPHPMTPEHHIAWVYLQTREGGTLNYLPIDGPPITTFILNSSDQVMNVYAYCNLHGLWQATLKA